jgi:hypothetical protein
MPKKYQTNMKFWLLIICFFLCLLWFEDAGAQSYNTLVFDNHQSEMFGAGNLSTLHKALYSFQDKIIPDTLFRENKWWKQSGGFVYRMARLWLFDAQIDYLVALSQHEMFGHGSRFREMGCQNNSFHLSLFFPFGGGHGFARTGDLKKGYVVTYAENIAITFSGNEGNSILANTLADQMLLDHSIHYRQALLYLISQNNLISYIWYTRLKKNSTTSYSNDIKSYIFETRNLYNGHGKAYTVQSLSEQSLITLANPLQLYAAYTILVKYGIRGKKQWNNIPMIPMGRVSYLPALAYDLTPFGSRYHLFNYFTYKNKLFSADLQYGDNRFCDFNGISLSAFNIIDMPRIGFNATMECWNQPDMELHKYAPLEIKHKAGGLIKLDVILRPFRFKSKLGLYLQLGYKTKGYSSGEPLDHSIILRYGISGRF